MRSLLLSALVTVLAACSAADDSRIAPSTGKPVTAAVEETGSITAALTVLPGGEPRCGSSAGLQDGAAWPMRGGCPTHAAVAPVHGSTQGTLDWKRQWLLLAPGASPAIGADGSVYVGTTTGVAVVDSATGADKWGTFLVLGVRSTPAIAKDGTVYVGSDLSWLHAIDPVTHAEKWSYDTGEMVSASPVVGADGTIYVANLAGSLFALRPNGTLKWKFVTQGAIESSPAIGPDGLVYFGANDGKVYALDANGVLKWKRSILQPVRSSPAVHNNTVYVGSDANRLHALDAATGTLRWEKDLGADVRSSPAVGPSGNVYVGSLSGKVYAYSPAGTALWTYQTGGPVYSSPTIDVDGRVYIGSDDKKLYAFDGATGARLFTYTAGAAVRSSPALDASGRVLFGDENLDLYSVGLGSPANRYALDPSVAPTDPVNIDSLTGENEPLSAFNDADGDHFEFTANELLLAGTTAQLNDYLSKYGGTLVQTVDAKPGPGDELANIFTIRIDPARAPDPATFSANLQRVAPELDVDSFRVADAQGLALLSTWADARSRGFEVEIDFVGDPATIPGGVTTEGPESLLSREMSPVDYHWSKTGARWSTNSFDWVHFAKDTVQSIGVPEAWQRLYRVGKLTRSVRVGFFDTGFSGGAAAVEYPDATLVPIRPGPGNNVFGAAEGQSYAWHGTAMVQIGFGRADNGQGAAGTGEAVVSKVVVSRFRKRAKIADLLLHLLAMKDEGVDIINVSSTLMVYSAMGGGMARKAIAAVGSKKILVVATAGNEHTNIDRTSGLQKNEKSEYMPCEAPGVLCIGGIAHDGLQRDPDSNWGANDVDLWAPFNNVFGPSPSGGKTLMAPGTSGSTAFVSGVAALVKAANNSLSAADVRNILIETGKGSTDARVYRIVQADAAVELALRGATAPAIQIIQPAEGASLPFNASPTGEVGWVDGRTGATAPAVEWRVNGTFVGNGLSTSLPTVAFGLGPATIEARATFMGGVVVTDTINVTRQLPSSLRILLPTPGQALRPEDVFQHFVAEPQGPVLWSLDGVSFVVGGDVTSPLPSPLAAGPHTLSAVLSDGTAQRRDEISVTLLPAGLPKTTATITSPPPGFIAEPSVPTAVSITALDGTVPTTGTVLWSVTNASSGATAASGSSTTGTFTVPASGRFVLTVSVQKLVDLDGDGTPETSVTMASDARAFTAQPTPT